ncbi:hypothetical protein BSKO_03994 [Bryopsis sp. KO-2023]|nr:hypothetical protein BSKO_03994 [Bryopsis sp. KO-2023]
MSLEDSRECLQRQVDEVEALLATFPEDGAVSLTSAQENCLNLARDSLLEEEGGVEGLGSLGLDVRVPEAKLSGKHVTLRFSLGKGYPVRDDPSVLVECDAPRWVHDHLTEVANGCLREMKGYECLLMVVDQVRAGIETLVASNCFGEDKTDPADSKPPDKLHFGVRVIWFHHIKSTTKRRHIMEWSRELGLRGYSKPGYPGVIVCEGYEENVADYVNRLRALRWAAMAVRAEERVEIEDGGDLEGCWNFKQPGFFELGEGGMSELANRCRDAGLEDVFLTALKISR